jgi:predicted DNA-binding transcriptional regulator AlpA
MTAPYSLITRQAAATFLKISLGTLDRRIDSRALPKPEPLSSGRRLYWRDYVFYAAVGNQITESAPGSVGVKPPTTATLPRPTSSVRIKRRPITGSATERARKRHAAQFTKVVLVIPELGDAVSNPNGNGSARSPCNNETPSSELGHVSTEGVGRVSANTSES